MTVERDLYHVVPLPRRLAWSPAARSRRRKRGMAMPVDLSKPAGQVDFTAAVCLPLLAL